MIQDHKEFEHSITSVAKMYGIRDRDMAEPLYSDSLRQAAVDSVVNMIRKIEREIAQYIAAHPEEFADEPEIVTVAREAV